MSEMSDKDKSQDEMILRNAESIRRNEEAIRHQTEVLEKICGHYFPRKTIWRKMTECILKAVGAVTVAAGILEAVDWYVNTSKTNAMATESAKVAMRLFLKENDAVGAAKFLEKAIELDGGTAKYRVPLGYVRGMAAVCDLYDLNRPLTTAERERVDNILAESVFLREVAPREPMAYVLAAQAYALRGEKDEALAMSDRAVSLSPDSAQVHVTACAMRFFSGDIAGARQRIAEAEKIDPNFPFVIYWRGLLALVADHDAKTALSFIDRLLAEIPRSNLAHYLRAFALMTGKTPDISAARASLSKALSINPKMLSAMVLMAETYEKDGNRIVARLWLDKALAIDSNCMKALEARARTSLASGDAKSSVADLTRAIGLAPFRGDLYRTRAKALSAAGRADEAAADLKTAEALDK